MLENIPSKISLEDNIELNKPISEAEIHSAIWSLDPDKAPGLDGLFYFLLSILLGLDQI
jgi:hypothetical protein